jgi:hypothetical protein
MAFYRSYRLDKDGRIVERHDFDAGDDAEAIELLGKRFEGSRFELWELGRRVPLPASA